jgi:hypothetical protein
VERGPLSLVSTIEELLERKSSGCCLENRDYGRRDPSRSLRGIIYPQNLALPSPSSGGRSVGIFHSRTQATESFIAICPSPGDSNLDAVNTQENKQTRKETMAIQSAHDINTNPYRIGVHRLRGDIHNKPIPTHNIAVL